MPAWGYVLIAVGIILVAALLWIGYETTRTRRLQERFGPEYERTLLSADSKSDAEADLEDRQKRRKQLDIRPLPASTRERYLDRWRRLQALFVDEPDRAFNDADVLVIAVMRDRGYPMEDFDQRAADVSVDHPEVVEHYREAHEVAEASRRGDADTEALRQGMVHYRALFEELVGANAGNGARSEVS